MDPAAIITTLTNSAALRADIASETYRITCETDTATSIHIDLHLQSITSTDHNKQTTVSTPNATIFCFAIVFRLAPLWRQAEGLKTIHGMHTISNFETEWTLREKHRRAPASSSRTLTIHRSIFRPQIQIWTLPSQKRAH